MAALGEIAIIIVERVAFLYRAVWLKLLLQYVPEDAVVACCCGADVSSVCGCVCVLIAPLVRYTTVIVTHIILFITMPLNTSTATAPEAALLLPAGASVLKF